MIFISGLPVSGETVQVRKDGSTIYVLLTISPICYQGRHWLFGDYPRKRM